jgi:hypothetical protein
MKRVFKWFIGLLLVPLCIGATQSAVRLLFLLHPSNSQWSTQSWAFILGFFLWIILYYSFPRPIRTYVLGHELTHALWALFFGANVSKLRVSSKGGSVYIDKSNFLITLAPYFFPFYAILIITCYYLIIMIFPEWKQYETFWLALVGITWGFHFTFTISMLLQHQTDIQEHGYLFSYTLIYLINILAICFWIVAITQPTVETYITFIKSDVLNIYLSMWSYIKEYIHKYESLSAQ